MIDHFGINCSDFGKAKGFYDWVLGVLGYTRQMDFGGNNVEAVFHGANP